MKLAYGVVAAALAAMPITGVAAQGAPGPSAAAAVSIPAAPGRDLHWVVWGPQPVGTSNSRLELRSKSRAVWTQRYAGAYGPQAATVQGWRYQGNPVLALRYRTSASSGHVAFYSIGRDTRPVKLGQLDGALIAPELAANTQIYSVYTSTNLSGDRRCYGWDRDAVRPRRCPAP